MKPSNLFIAGLVLIAAAALSGCRKEKGDPKGERLVTARAPISLSEIRPEDVQSQSLLSQKLIATSLKLSGKLTDMVDTLTPTILLTTLLNASENETSERLIKGMGIHEGRQDKFTKTLQAQLDHLRVKGGDEAKFNAALWMIWPILLTPDFQEEIGGKLGVSIYRLGNAGLTSTERIKAWGADFSPERKRFELQLDKRDVMLATTVCSLYTKPQSNPRTTSHKGHEISFVKVGNVLEAVKITGPDPSSLLGSLDLISLSKTAKPVSNVNVPPMPSTNRQSHEKLLQEAGFDYLFKDTNDWRYMAMELRANGLAEIVSFSGIRWKTEEFLKPEPDALVLVWVPESGLVLAGGKGMALGTNRM